MPFIIKVWIPVPVEDPQKYTSKEAAVKDLVSLELMQPENKYEIAEV